VTGRMSKAVAQAVGTMIDCSRAGAHLPGSCHSPQHPTSRKSNSDEAHNRAKAGVQAAEVNPWRCSPPVPAVVETGEPATETTLEDVLARNLSIYGARPRNTQIITAHGHACAINAAHLIVW
jgi:hypothetical protein